MWSTVVYWTVTQILVSPVYIIATSQVSNAGQSWVTNYVDMTPTSSILTVFVSKNKQVIQIQIQVSHVEAVSTWVEFGDPGDVW